MTYRITLATSLAALAFMAPRLAAAQAACGDVECPKGYECKTEPTVCPTIDCVDAEGAECPPCEPSEESFCSPLPCASDADCASGMTCYSREETECTGGAAPPPDDGEGADDGGAAEAPAPTEPECTTATVSQCVPNWALPCEAAADCGPGFTCEELEECGCTGSEGRPGPDAPPTPEADTAPAPAPASGDCTCQPSGEFACHLVVTACATDDQCAEGFTCVDNPEGVCSSSSDGTISCEPGDPPRLCVPPYSDIFAGGRGVATDEENGGGKGTSGPGTGSAADDAAGASESEGGGCSVASGRSNSPGLVAMVALGLAAAFASRRKVSGLGVARRGAR